MDAFFASIEQRDDPLLRSKPVVVGADPKLGKGRGVVSTCSYEARGFGIHSAMPISEAYRRCPNAAFLLPDIERYVRISNQIYDILYSFTPDIKPVGIDEAFLDITGSYHLFGTPLETCLRIKSKIKEVTGLNASIGLAPTKMAAKIASDLKKPDGMVEVTEEGLLDFLRPLEVRKLWGLGKRGEGDLNKIGIRTIGDLARCNIEVVVDIMGRAGIGLWQLANGIDESPVEALGKAKSISNEITFDKDTNDEVKIESSLMALAEKVSGRLRHDGLKCKNITLKIRLTGFETFTRSITIESSTNFADILYKETKRMYNDFETKGKKVRLVGLKVAKLSSGNFKESLFEDTCDGRSEKIHSAMDKIRDRFGDGSIYRAGARGE